MTAFSTRCSPSRGLERLSCRLRAALIAVCTLWLMPAWAGEGATIKSAELIPGEEWVYLYADIDVTFPKALEEALNKGVSLNFMLEFELTRPRWYWLDETVASVRQNLRLSYHALTRQYQFSSNQGNRSYASLAEAREELKHITEWKVLDRSQLKKGVTYQGALRLRLDVNQLPKPLQVEALSSKDWSFNSDWYRFTVTP
ncbi:DUF4390 domain-containing protein [Thiobacter aerophilum]|uniref:DUF4390 domain-containing protein n=1 Tax=Thiobacter aerophilum TaxID=3121275 RepID=A0ABV0ED02_9BURK